MAAARILMLPLCFFFIILLINLVWLGDGDRGVPYDYLLLAKTWPPSVCNMRPEFPNCSTPRVLPKYFIIHGLWPQNYTEGTTVNCQAYNDPFIYEMIKYGHNYFFQDLQHYWPSLSSTDNKDLWAEEWRKHGTCSNMNLLQYFHISVGLVKTYDLKYALWSSENKIKPGGSYNKEHILNAITAKTKSLPGLSCSDTANGNRQLYEIYLCISKIEFSFIDCPPNIFRSPSCPDVIYYPA